MGKSDLVLIVVEIGWQKSRELSLELLRKGLSADILIKGLLDRQVLDMITKYPGINIESMGRFWFKPVLFGRIIMGSFSGRLKAVVIEGKKIQKWIYLLSRLFGFRAFLANDEGCYNI